MKTEGDIILFVRKKDFIMVNPNLGGGSFGKTVVLKDPLIDELFVAKKYEPDYFDEDEKIEFFNSFQQEIKIMYKLSHENIVRVFNYYLYPEIFTGYIIMEYIDGMNIEEYIQNICPWDAKDDLDKLFIQLVNAFSYMEENRIVHRDIREGNILIDNNGCVKIIDFGLGKIFKKIENDSNDSLANVINRAGLDALPEEYSTEKYDSRTDMFYLAELLRRLIKKNNLDLECSYMNILNKMASVKRENRYQSFAEVKQAISQKKFLTLEISYEDKVIYRNFANSIAGALVVFLEKPKFCLKPHDFSKSLDIVIKNNLLENEIQKVEDLVSCIAESGFRYHSNRHISVDDVVAFRNWFVGLDEDSQILILRNISYKLSKIKVEQTLEDDIPF